MEIILTFEEEKKLSTICEFLFFDPYTDKCRYLRYEKCLQPLFSNTKISMITVFKEICGPKKKYITFKRLTKAYLNHKNGKNESEDTKIFFDKLFNSIMIEENFYVGKTSENTYTFSTKKVSKNYNSITRLQILCDKQGKILGVSLFYDGVYQSKMFPKNIEDDIDVNLDITLKVLDEKLIKDNADNFSKIMEGNCLDAITHIFGTINKKTGFITFLGFKNISGKLFFIGFPEGEGFLFGNYGKKLHDLKIQMTEGGITKLEPIFIKNLRKNIFIQEIINELPNINLEEDDFIKEEEAISNLKNEHEIDKYITTSIIDNEIDSKENEKTGKDYKEVVDQCPRDWILQSDTKKKFNIKQFKSLKTQDGIKKYIGEYNKNSYLSKLKIMEMNSNANVEDNSENPDNNVFNAFTLGKKTNFSIKKFISSKITFKNNLKEISSAKKNIKLPSPAIKSSQTLPLNYRIKQKQKKWNGIVDETTTPNLFFNSDNYKKLENKIGKIIHQEILKNNEDESQNLILNEYIPFEEKKENKNKISNENINKPKELKMINLKGETNIIQEKDLAINKKKTKKIEEKSEENKNNVVIYSDASYFWKKINIETDLNKKKENENDFKKKGSKLELKLAQEKWIKFRKGLEKINGLYLFRTIGIVIRALHVLEKKVNISISEKIKLYEILKKNENIIQFLSQNVENEEVDEPIDILIPDEHPEKITSLTELQNDIENIKILLTKKTIKEDEKLKLNSLLKLYFHQKNILIENETNSYKEKIKSLYWENINKYLEEEMEHRRKAQEKVYKNIEKEQRKLDFIRKETKRKLYQLNESIFSRKISTSIFHNQKIPKENTTFKDDIFFSTKDSLCPNDEDGWIYPEYVEENDVQGWDDVEWCRVEEIKDFEEYSVFLEGANIYNIEQRNIGDCYFFSAVGSLCSYPDFFYKLFHIKERSKEHLYGIYLYLNGKWKLVLLDDYFPYKECIFKEFYFSCSLESEIWVSLIEKAWAKVNGCYARIGCGGLCNEAFDVLTEAYTEHIYIIKKKKDEIWKKMEKAIKKNYVMTAGTASDDNEEINKVGLSPSHAYSLMNIYNVKTSSGMEKLVKLRNPWGNNEFSGDWSHISKKWTPKLKKQFDYSGENDDGIFYMSYNDFIKYFIFLDIAKLEPGYKTTFCKIKKTEAKRCQIIRLIVNEENKNTFVQLYQKNPRIVRKNGTYYPKTVMSYIMLVKFENDLFKYIKSISGNKMHLAIEVDLEPGIYFAFCDVIYRYVYNETYGYTVTCYSKNPILLDNVTNNINGIKALNLSIYDYCKQKIKPIKYKKGLDIYNSQNFNNELPFKIVCFSNLTNRIKKIKLDVKTNIEKSFCIYNDNVASEFDTSVIKEVKSGLIESILIYEYSRLSEFEISYEILSHRDLRTYENTHPVFDNEGEQIDESGNLFYYVLKVEDKGYVIGLENKSNYEFGLILKLVGFVDIDNEYFGVKNPQFKIEPNSKKVFNLKFLPDAKECIFNFDFI